MIPLRDQERLRQRFERELLGQVRIDYFTQRDLPIYLPGKEPCQYCKPTQELLQELAGLTDKISLRVHILDEAREEAERFGVERVPAIVLRGRDSVQLKFYGFPGGNEFPGLIETIVDLSRGSVPLPQDLQQKVRRLKEPAWIRVFVTPT